MQNLGYLQLSGNPGPWDLSLAEGRGSALFEIVTPPRGAKMWWSGEGATAATHRSVVVRDFAGGQLQLRVRKKEGLEAVPLLVEGKEAAVAVAAETAETAAAEDDGMWGAVSRMFGGGEPDAATTGDDDEDEVIHVFSLATGHLSVGRGGRRGRGSPAPPRVAATSAFCAS